MSKTIILEPGKYYHIYNRGVNRTNLFYRSSNYYHFLRLYDKYISLVADTFAYCLLKNHFHLLVRIKEKEEIVNPDWVLNPVRVTLPPYRYFSHLFNAYCQAINKQERRTGPLFERPFHRLEVATEDYFRQLIIYIHTNPVKHRFTDDYKDYPWSSYGSILSLKKSKSSYDQVIGWFNDKAQFILNHEQGNDQGITDIFKDEFII